MTKVLPDYEQINFGKYRGMTPQSILDLNPGYIVWLNKDITAVKFSDSIEAKARTLQAQYNKDKSMMNKALQTLRPEDWEQLYTNVFGVNLTRSTEDKERDVISELSGQDIRTIRREHGDSACSLWRTHSRNYANIKHRLQKDLSDGDWKLMYKLLYNKNANDIDNMFKVKGFVSEALRNMPQNKVNNLPTRYAILRIKMLALHVEGREFDNLNHNKEPNTITKEIKMRKSTEKRIARNSREDQIFEALVADRYKTCAVTFRDGGSKHAYRYDPNTLTLETGQHVVIEDQVEDEYQMVRVVEVHDVNDRKAVGWVVGVIDVKAHLTRKKAWSEMYEGICVVEQNKRRNMVAGDYLNEVSENAPALVDMFKAFANNTPQLTSDSSVVGEAKPEADGRSVDGGVSHD